VSLNKEPSDFHICPAFLECLISYYSLKDDSAPSDRSYDIEAVGLIGLDRTLCSDGAHICARIAAEIKCAAREFDRRTSPF